MLYKYKGGKFKINDAIVMSEGDILDFSDDYTNFKVTNVTTNKVIPENSQGFWFGKIYSKLEPLTKEDIENDNIDEVDSKVEHPKHYTWLKRACGVEVIDITRHMDFDLGNALKYILRSGYKSELGYTSKEKQIEDLKKAIWYINDKIDMLNN